jgi:hypothetical protein
MQEMTVCPPVTSYGMAWDAEWLGPDHLRVRGWQARTGLSALAAWDVDALIATVDGALEAANWAEIDRRAARTAIRALYANDLAGVPVNPSL